MKNVISKYIKRIKARFTPKRKTSISFSKNTYIKMLVLRHKSKEES